MRRTIRSPHYRAAALALAAIAALDSACFAIGDSGGGAVPATGAYPYVGRAQDEDTPLGSHLGTGSYIRRGFVLTAGHNSDTDTSANAWEGSFERFQLPGGVQGFALPIWEPGYSVATLNDNDQALWYVVNAPSLGTYGTLWDGTGGGTFPAVNDAVSVIGFTGSAANGNPLLGTMKVKTANPGGTNSLIDLADNPNFTQGGDSGGPYIRNIGGTDVIVASHRSGNAASNPGAGNYVSTGVRVWEATRRGFLLGDGLGGARVVDRMTDPSSGFFDVSGRWARGSANTSTAPQANDVAIVDPTFGSDAATTQIQADIDTPNMFGLVSDVRFLVRAKVNVTGESGVLNTGNMIVDDPAGLLTASWQLDNPGSLTIQTGGVVNVGASIPSHPTALFLFALLNASNGTSSGNLLVDGGGQLNVASSDPNQFAAARNQSFAVWNVRGNAANGVGTFTTQAFVNDGSFNVQAKGLATVSGVSSLRNGFVIVAGSGADSATFNAGAVSQTGGAVIVADLGVMTASRAGGIIPAGDAYSMNTGATLTINSGGQLTVTAGGKAPIGNAFNSGNGGIVNVNAGGSAIFNGNSLVNDVTNINGGASAGILEARNNGASHGQLFVGGDGVINFGGGATHPQLNLRGADLVATGQFKGTGDITFFGDSSYDIRTIGSLSPVQNNNGVSLLFDGDTGNMETPSEDVGAVAAGLSDIFAFAHLCAVDGSVVSLVDSIHNEDTPPEAIYTKEFGVDATSTINLNGLTIYYESLDPSCGGLSGTINLGGGELIQIPEPMNMAFVLGAVLPLFKRRSRQLRAQVA